jgi:hypothetical protein
MTAKTLDFYDKSIREANAIIKPVDAAAHYTFI